MKTILHTVDVRAGCSAVYDALVSESGLAGWWSTQVDADTSAGGLVRFTFIPIFTPVMRITSLEEAKHVEWTCIGGHEPWEGSTFRFDIQPRAPGSMLLFRQEYARELSTEEYGRYNFNWGCYLNSLKSYAETGAGSPFDPRTLNPEG